MKKKDLYKIVKESLSEILKEQQKSLIPSKGTPNMMPLACSGTQSYGEITVYNSQDNESGECVGQTINDKFICCSGNNPNSNIANGSYTIETPYGQITVPASGNVDCFPDNNITNNQFTFEQFSSWFEGITGSPLCESSPGAGDGYMVCPGENFGCNTQVGGCPHPLSVGTEYPALYNPDSQGCLDENDNLIGNGMDISCCQFQGCGAVDANPQALNVSYDLYPAIGDFPAVNINEDAPYWVDDSSCQFPSICTEETVTINGIQYNTNGYSSIPTVQNSPNYTTYVGGGQCQVGVCTDTNLKNPVDNLGNIYNNEGYPGYETGFVIEIGIYNGHQISPDLGECSITVCTDSSFDNYYNPNDENNWGFGINPEYTQIPNDLLCANATISGCTDSTACNYNELADTDDGSCIYPEEGFDCAGIEIPIPGCTNDLSNPIGTNGVFNPNATEDDGNCEFNYCLDPTAENYVCITYSTELCNGGTEYDNTLGNWTLGENNLGTGCEYPVVGCVDQTQNNDGSYQATNYNEFATEPCDGTNSGGDLNLECIEGIDGTLQTIETNDRGCCCNYIVGCMDPNTLNYNPAATVNDGCIFEVLGCTSPGFDGYDKNANVDDGSCKIEGCMMEDPQGLATDSPWANYVCLEYTDPVSGIHPDTGEELELLRREWLCHCGSHPYAIGECSQASTPQYDLGNFIDPNVFDSNEGLNLYSFGTDLNNDGLTDENSQIFGLCNVLLDNEGCHNNGSPFYFQNDGTGPISVEINGFTEYALDEGFCDYAACNNPYASNYFCVDNPGLCTTDTSNFGLDNGCADPNVEGNYPEGGVTCLDKKFGNLNTPNYSCTFPESYICGPKGCMDPGDGTGEYSTLNQCEQSCNICSTVQVETCQGTFTKTFDCLFIDGEMGDPDCNTSGLYCVGQEFEIPESSGFGPPLTGTTTDSQGNAISIDRPRPNEKFSNRTYRVLSITNQILAVPEQQGTSTTCPEIGGERPRDPQRPDGDSGWCGTDIDIEGNSVIDNPQAKVTINCCSEEGYPTPYTMLNSVYQTLCTVSGVLNPLNHLEFCEEKTGGTYGIPPCNYVTPIDPDRGERPPDEPMPDDPDFYGDKGNTINESKINKLREIIKKIIKNQK